MHTEADFLLIEATYLHVGATFLHVRADLLLIEATYLHVGATFLHVRADLLLLEATFLHMKAEFLLIMVNWKEGEFMHRGMMAWIYSLNRISRIVIDHRSLVIGEEMK